jgi:hypothetical protein
MMVNQLCRETKLRDKGWNLPKEKGRPKVLLSLSFFFKNVGRYLLGNMLCVMRRQAFKVDMGTHSHPKRYHIGTHNTFN